MHNLDTLPDILDPKMISQYLGIGYAKALELVKKGFFPVIRVGNGFKVPKHSFAAWLEQPGLRKVL